jgi:small subunit ribosomal protein S15
VTEEELTNAAEPQPLEMLSGTLWMPRLLNFGVGEEEKKLLFERLPPLTSEIGGIRNPLSWTTTKHAEAEKLEMNKANMLARVLDLRNANAAGIAYENRRRIIAAFSEGGTPNDTGRPEVQAALLTMRIRNLWDHLQRRRSDRGNRPRLAKMVHHRAKILKYLKAHNRQRYDDILPRLGLEPGSVEGELMI